MDFVRTNGITHLKFSIWFLTHMHIPERFCYDYDYTDTLDNHKLHQSTAVYLFFEHLLCAKHCSRPKLINVFFFLSWSLHFHQEKEAKVMQRK